MKIKNILSRCVFFVKRDSTSFVTSFNVTITTREYSGDPSTLTSEQLIVTPNIGMTIIL